MDYDLSTTGSSVQTTLGTLHVWDLGSGPPTLLWHSLFVDSTTWQRVLGPLTARRRVILVDGPGHGASRDTLNPFTLDDCAASARDVLDVVGVTGPVDWVGNAWGGHVGIVFAASRPEGCRSLVAIGAPVHPLSRSEHRVIAASRALYRRLGPVRPLTTAITKALLGADSDPDDAQLVAEAFRRADRQGMSTAITSISLNRQDLTPTLPHITTPTLMIAGADDKIWTPTQAQHAAQRLKHGASDSLPGGGHVGPLLQAAPALVDRLKEFWDSEVPTIQARDAL
jgi:pimeloyl-ACP methyl ester carboxylesterase